MLHLPSDHRSYEQHEFKVTAWHKMWIRRLPITLSFISGLKWPNFDYHTTLINYFFFHKIVYIFKQHDYNGCMQRPLFELSFPIQTAFNKELQAAPTHWLLLIKIASASNNILDKKNCHNTRGIFKSPNHYSFDACASH